MSKQFTVITKDGSKWLRPADVLSDVFNVIYIGNRPEGAVVDESQVRKITQVEDYPEWITPHPDNLVDWLETSHEIRSAYVDVEPSHDRHIRPFNTQNVRPLVNQLVGEEISFSRFVELLNEIANELR